MPEFIASQKPKHETRFHRRATFVHDSREKCEVKPGKSNIGGTAGRDNAGFGNAPFPATSLQ
ncbi:hypothetical protein [Sphingomonas sp. UNC305MFCol5.2]|uniref:hypothetical protein n=1 Tax=Sphingomonas sp. UNC305MFCol5.2 TaxID=1449076 RepID=UPI001E49399F|nr:hypothetical protein [Sphingomonas sp. UNC305MFCol5.2]